MINYDWERIEWNTKTRTNDLYSSKSNTNSMYHFLCFTLYFTNHVFFFFFFFHFKLWLFYKENKTITW